jgi:phosphate transport system substrate-binding protein
LVSISPEAQNQAATVDYAPLPEKAVEKAKGILRTVTYNGESAFEIIHQISAV